VGLTFYPRGFPGVTTPLGGHNMRALKRGGEKTGTLGRGGKPLGGTPGEKHGGSPLTPKISAREKRP